ncbi:Mitochondrial acidic protein [Yarrowia sp. C11]|nr:Mitochondrial acidic protein [Yarrowia sp. C11]KAG5358767.1 Mitochondrial acidic protein [Yarrowia sp. E02]
MSRALLRINAAAVMRQALRASAPQMARMATPAFTRALSTSRPAFSSEAIATELVARLTKEIEYENSVETEIAEESGSTGKYRLPKEIDNELTKSGFEIVYTASKDELELVKKLDNGDVTRVFVSLGAVAQPAPDAFGEEGEMEGVEDMEMPDMMDINVVIDRSAKGALSIHGQIDEGEFVISTITPYKDGKLATIDDANTAAERRNAYEGPYFYSLDEDLQRSVQDYIQSRGVDTAFLLLLPEIAETFENRSYKTYLASIRDVVA